MIVLDSNVISAFMRPAPDPKALAWLDRQPAESIWTTSICVFEVRFGINILAPGKRRTFLDQAFTRVLDQVLERRILDFDAPAAKAAADLAAKLRSQGRSIEMRDLLIAGVVAGRSAKLATNNTRHFLHAGIDLVDPWGA